MTQLRHVAFLAAAGLATATTTAQSTADRWPQWRGPSRSGVMAQADAPTTWPAELTKGWSVEVGEGYSSPVADGARVYVHSRRDPEEVVAAIDLTTGKVAWEQRYTSPIEKNPYAKEMAKGPYSTPLLAQGRLFTFGTSAILSAWDAPTGKLLWRKDFSARIDTSKLFCGTAMSPLATSSGLIVHVGDDRAGSMMALDPATGKERWTAAVSGPGYASPIEITVGGTAQIVTMTTRSAVGVDTASGKLLWEFPFKDEWNENIVTPIAVQGGVIVSGVRQGTRRLALTNSGGVWSAAEAWHTADVGMYMSSPVLARDTLFGHSTKRKGSFVAIDPGTGRIKWSTEGRDASSASIIAAGSHLLFLTSEAQLIVTALDPQAYSEVRRYTVAPSAIYAHPIVFHDRLIVRDATSVRLWRL